MSCVCRCLYVGPFRRFISGVRTSVCLSVCPIGHALKVTHQGQHRRGQRTFGPAVRARYTCLDCYYTDFEKKSEFSVYLNLFGVIFEAVTG